MTAKETAVAIRHALKSQFGYTAKQVGVRSDYNSVRVVIKDPMVDIPKVTTLAESHERIDRCPITGDILGGGNLYISVVDETR